MRRIMGYGLVSIGLFLVFLSPLLRFYTYPRVLKAPLDTYDVTKSFGSGTYFSLKVFRPVGPTQLVNTSTARGDIHAADVAKASGGSKRIAVYDYFSTTKDVGPGGGVIDASQDRYVFDRVTAQPVHCCGESPRHEGFTLKFPFNVQRKAYPFWDGTAKAAFPAQYTGESTLEGLKVYVFRQHINPMQISTLNVPGSIAGQPDVKVVPAFIYYQADTTLYVEPFTGAILRGSQHGVRLLQLGDGTPVLTISNTYLSQSDESVRKTAQRIKSKYAQLKLVQVWLPIFGPIVGVILVAVGILLTRKPPITVESEWRLPPVAQPA